MRFNKRKSERLIRAERRRRQAANLYLRGLSQVEIADRLHCSQGTVSRALERVAREWREAACRHYEEWLAEQLARVNNLEAEAWRAWNESSKPAEAVTKQEGKGRDGLTVTTTITRRSTAGNPAFLTVILDCLRERGRLLGLYSPIKVAQTSPDGSREYGELSDQERATMIQAILGPGPRPALPYHPR